MVLVRDFFTARLVHAFSRRAQSMPWHDGEPLIAILSATFPIALPRVVLTVIPPS
jgi:hypothetical protein